jgi:hypothetical protein
MLPDGFKLHEIGAGQTHSRHNHYQITASLDEGSFRGPSGLCIIRLPAGCETGVIPIVKDVEFNTASYGISA